MMIRDGRSKVYNTKCWWEMDFQIRRDGEELQITYLNFGVWYPVPAKYGLAPLVKVLLTMAVHKKRRRYELDVIRTGHVFLDKGRELALEPPGS
jgi:hypothetical protein